MRKLVEFQILDINADYYGVDFFELMTNAGAQVAKHICDNIEHTIPVKFICGHGNNGGDGFVAAGILKDEGFDVEVYYVKEPKTETSKRALSNYNGNIKKITKISDFGEKSVIIVDCLLGSGIIGQPRSPYKEIIGKVNQFENVISVDVPSGFGTPISVKPSQTITFHDKKTGMSQNNCGEIIIVDIGFSSDIDELTGPGELLLFPKFDSKKHKGQNGKVAVIGGGEFSGAPALAAIGAYRSGVDLVHVFVPEVSYEQVSSFAPELIVHKLEGNRINKGFLLSIVEDEFDSIVIGPGMGKHEDSIEAVQFILDNFENVVIDADAIDIYNFRKNNILLTPHLGELKRLKVENDRLGLMAFTRSNNVSLLLKGEKDFITDGNYFKINTTGHPRMAVGGTGDLLSGLCGGLMGRGLSPFEAGRLGAYVLGRAGEFCHEEYGAGFLPTDLGLCISKILAGK